jgi:hypothetical protein
MVIKARILERPGRRWIIFAFMSFLIKRWLWFEVLICSLKLS